jgi:hypothetical protein
MNFTAWVREGGLDPTGMLNFTTPNLTLAQNLAKEYIADPSKSPESYTVYEGWYSSLHVIFLE